MCTFVCVCVSKLDQRGRKGVYGDERGCKRTSSGSPDIYICVYTYMCVCVCVCVCMYVCVRERERVCVCTRECV